ncbi:MAG: hypothetical protein ACRC5C_10185 [Bacilli bacterium]
MNYAKESIEQHVNQKAKTQWLTEWMKYFIPNDSELKQFKVLSSELAEGIAHQIQSLSVRSACSREAEARLLRIAAAYGQPVSNIAELQKVSLALRAQIAEAETDRLRPVLSASYAISAHGSLPAIIGCPAAHLMLYFRVVFRIAMSYGHDVRRSIPLHFATYVLKEALTFQDDYAVRWKRTVDAYEKIRTPVGLNPELEVTPYALSEIFLRFFIVHGGLVAVAQFEDDANPGFWPQFFGQLMAEREWSRVVFFVQSVYEYCALVEAERTAQT